MNSFFSDLVADIEVGSIDISLENSSYNGVAITTHHLAKDEEICGRMRRRGSYHVIDNASTIEENNLISALASILSSYIGASERILIVGFGNDNYMCDKLGTATIRGIDTSITSRKIVAISPSVESVTGMSSIDIVMGVMSRFSPELIIAIDTLATANMARLANSIQVTNTGISPGSGVYNGGKHIDFDALGVPIIALGVPLVISARALGVVGGNVEFFQPSLLDDIVTKYARVISRGIMRALTSI